jgi:hypothetical protein
LIPAGPAAASLYSPNLRERLYEKWSSGGDSLL